MNNRAKTEQKFNKLIGEMGRLAEEMAPPRQPIHKSELKPIAEELSIEILRMSDRLWVLKQAITTEAQEGRIDSAYVSCLDDILEMKTNCLRLAEEIEHGLSHAE